MSSEDLETKDATSSVGSSNEFRIVEDPAMEKRVWRKIDMYVLPIVAMFYLLSFLVSFLDEVSTLIELTS